MDEIESKIHAMIFCSLYNDIRVTLYESALLIDKRIKDGGNWLQINRAPTGCLNLHGWLGIILDLLLSPLRTIPRDILI